MAVERDPKHEAAVEIPRRLCHLNLSFLRDRRLKRILSLMGHDLRPALPPFCLPRPGDGDNEGDAGDDALAAQQHAGRQLCPEQPERP